VLKRAPTAIQDIVPFCYAGAQSAPGTPWRAPTIVPFATRERRALPYQELRLHIQLEQSHGERLERKVKLRPVNPCRVRAE